MKRIKILKYRTGYDLNTNEIYSFKRKSDGQIFTIGDIVSIEDKWRTNDCKIHAIKFVKNKDDWGIEFFDDVITIIQGGGKGNYKNKLEQWVNISNKNKKLYKIY